MGKPHLNMPSDWAVSDTDRFFALFEQRGTDECWKWTGSAGGPTSQGRFGFRNRSYIAPRVAYWLWHQEDPGEWFVCHDCPGGDNPECVNPSHLWLGHPSDNSRDMKEKGRAATGDRHMSRTRPDLVRRGERTPRAKLTAEKVVEILNSTESTRALSKRYGVSFTAIWVLRRGETWKHIPRPTVN